MGRRTQIPYGSRLASRVKNSGCTAKWGAGKPPRGMADKKQKQASLLQQFLLALSVVGIGATLLGFAGAWYWLFDLFAHFRVQYLIGLALLGGLCLLAKAWRALALCSLALALNAMVVVPLYLPPAESAFDPATPHLRIVSLNVRTSNREFEAVAEFLRRQNANLILLEEVDRAWLEAMTNSLSEYRMVAGQPYDHNFGIALFVRSEDETERHIVIEHAEVGDITAGVAQVDAVSARLRWFRRPVSLLGLHTIPPGSEQGAHARDVELAAAARWASDEQSQDAATIVLGDFNATPWSHAFRRTLRDGNLVDSEVGFGVQPSWHRNFPPALGIPIDHCLHSRGLRAVQRIVTGEDLGSDHRPLVVVLAWLASEPAAP